MESAVKSKPTVVDSRGNVREADDHFIVSFEDFRDYIKAGLNPLPIAPADSNWAGAGKSPCRVGVRPTRDRSDRPVGNPDGWSGEPGWETIYSGRAIYEDPEWLARMERGMRSLRRSEWGYNLGLMLGVELADGSYLIGLDDDREYVRTNGVPASHMEKWLSVAIERSGASGKIPWKQGRKGGTWFLRVNRPVSSADFDWSAPADYFPGEGDPVSGSIQLLAKGKQTVCPPSVHPAINADGHRKFYEWVVADGVVRKMPGNVLEIPLVDWDVLEDVLKQMGCTPRRSERKKASSEAVSQAEKDWVAASAAEIDEEDLLRRLKANKLIDVICLEVEEGHFFGHRATVCEQLINNDFSVEDWLNTCLLYPEYLFGDVAEGKVSNERAYVIHGDGRRKAVQAWALEWSTRRGGDKAMTMAVADDDETGVRGADILRFPASGARAGVSARQGEDDDAAGLLVPFPGSLKPAARPYVDLLSSDADDDLPVVRGAAEAIESLTAGEIDARVRSALAEMATPGEVVRLQMMGLGSPRLAALAEGVKAIVAAGRRVMILVKREDDANAVVAAIEGSVLVPDIANRGACERNAYALFGDDVPTWESRANEGILTAEDYRAGGVSVKSFCRMVLGAEGLEVAGEKGRVCPHFETCNYRAKLPEVHSARVLVRQGDGALVSSLDAELTQRGGPIDVLIVADGQADHGLRPGGIEAVRLTQTLPSLPAGLDERAAARVETALGELTDVTEALGRFVEMIDERVSDPRARRRDLSEVRLTTHEARSCGLNTLNLAGFIEACRRAENIKLGGADRKKDGQFAKFRRAVRERRNLAGVLLDAFKAESRLKKGAAEGHAVAVAQAIDDDFAEGDGAPAPAPADGSSGSVYIAGLWVERKAIGDGGEVTILRLKKRERLVAEYCRADVVVFAEPGAAELLKPVLTWRRRAEGAKADQPLRLEVVSAKEIVSKSALNVDVQPRGGSKASGLSRGTLIGSGEDGLAFSRVVAAWAAGVLARGMTVGVDCGSAMASTLAGHGAGSIRAALERQGVKGPMVGCNWNVRSHGGVALMGDPSITRPEVLLRIGRHLPNLRTVEDLAQMMSGVAVERKDASEGFNGLGARWLPGKRTEPYRHWQGVPDDVATIETFEHADPLVQIAAASLGMSSGRTGTRETWTIAAEPVEGLLDAILQVNLRYASGQAIVGALMAGILPALGKAETEAAFAWVEDRLTDGDAVVSGPAEWGNAARVLQRVGAVAAGFEGEGLTDRRFGRDMIAEKENVRALLVLTDEFARKGVRKLAIRPKAAKRAPKAQVLPVEVAVSAEMPAELVEMTFDAEEVEPLDAFAG